MELTKVHIILLIFAINFMKGIYINSSKYYDILLFIILIVQ